MVEQNIYLDNIFSSLADPTRRDILRRLTEDRLSVSDIARPYSTSLAAISKHLRVLEKAGLIVKRRRGKEQIVHLSPKALADAVNHLQWYGKHLEGRFDNLETFLKESKQEK